MCLQRKKKHFAMVQAGKFWADISEICPTPKRNTRVHTHTTHTRTHARTRHTRRHRGNIRSLQVQLMHSSLTQEETHVGFKVVSIFAFWREFWCSWVHLFCLTAMGHGSGHGQHPVHLRGEDLKRVLSRFLRNKGSSSVVVLTGFHSNWRHGS